MTRAPTTPVFTHHTRLTAHRRRRGRSAARRALARPLLQRLQANLSQEGAKMSDLLETLKQYNQVEAEISKISTSLKPYQNASARAAAAILERQQSSGSSRQSTAWARRGPSLFLGSCPAPRLALHHARLFFLHLARFHARLRRTHIAPPPLRPGRWRATSSRPRCDIRTSFHRPSPFPGP